MLSKVELVHIIKRVQESSDTATSSEDKGHSQHVYDHGVEVVKHVPHHFFLHLNSMSILDTGFVSVVVKIS